MLEDANLTEENFEENTAARSWGTKVTIGDEVFATSLFWQPLQNKEDPSIEVKEASESLLEGADLYCIKGGKTSQFGICVSSEGYKPGEQIAAVTLTSALSSNSSYVAVFKVKEGWWYTCVRNDIILSDGDMLFINEEEARNQFISMLAVPDWGKKICPKEWGFEDAEQPDLEELMQRGVRAKLQRIKGISGPKLLLLIGVAVVVGLWLISSLISSIFAPPKKPVIAPVAPKAQQAEVPPEKKPWEELTDPTAVMVSCRDKIAEIVRILPPGWIVGDLTCNSGGANVSWRREVGRLSWITKALEVSDIRFSSQAASDDGNSMTASSPLNPITKVMSPPMMNQTELRNTINDLFQAIGQQISMTNNSYTSPQQNVYRSIKFRFRSTHDPVVWNDLLIKFSGLEINMIKYSPSGKIWEYEGTIYAL